MWKKTQDVVDPIFSNMLSKDTCEVPDSLGAHQILYPTHTIFKVYMYIVIENVQTFVAFIRFKQPLGLRNFSSDA